MKKALLGTLLVVLVLSFSGLSFADTYVHGYTRSNGTYVQPHYRSSPDSTVTNNYSYSGNTNPYTGQTGSNRYEHDVTSPNYSGPDSHGRSGHSSYGLGLGSDSDLDPYDNR